MAKEKKNIPQDALPAPLTTEQVIAQKDARIAELELTIQHYKQDPLYSAYYAWARKVNETAEAINSFTLALTSEDRSFERYVALLKVQPEQMELIDKLRTVYLKKSEEQLEEIKTKSGIPLIEQRAKTKIARK